MKLPEAIAKACQEPTLLDALSWIAVWESERVVVQAHNFKVTGIPTGSGGAGWDTCFRTCFAAVMEAWQKKEKESVTSDVTCVW